MSRNILKSSLKNVGFSIIFQIVCRFVTFGINAFIVRRVGSDILGLMNVRLLLLESTLLFISREAVMRASLSATSQQKNKSSWTQVMNLIWLSVPICILCIPICLYIWFNVWSPVEPRLVSQYTFACYSIAVSCIIELSAEAPVFVAQVFCFVKFKILMNTLYILIRSVIFIWIVLTNDKIAITAFGIAQVSTAVTIFLGNYTFFHWYTKKLQETRQTKSKDKEPSELFQKMDDFPFASIKEMLPSGIGKIQNLKKEDLDEVFNMELLILTWSFFKQGFFKYLLTEGEKILMSLSSVFSFSEQGIYDVVNNLGSLAARFIFRPVEDNAYFYFTQTISRDVPLVEQNREKIMEAGKVLKYLCATVTTIGLIALAFGQSYSETVLFLYGGEKLVQGAVLLKWHSVAICLMAVNGVSEGYMFATNTSQGIDNYKYFMLFFSVMFLVLSFILTYFMGPVGFILANCINMICRIFYSLRFINDQYKPIGINPLFGVVPGKMFVIVLVILGVLCKFSENIFSECIMCHLVVGGVCGLLCIAAWCLENRELLSLFLSSKYGNKLKMKSN